MYKSTHQAGWGRGENPKPWQDLASQRQDNSSTFCLIFFLCVTSWNRTVFSNLQLAIYISLSIHSSVYARSVLTEHPLTEARGHSRDSDFTPGRSVNWHSSFEKGVGSAVCISKPQKVPTLWPSNTVSVVLPRKTRKKKKQANIFMHKIICCSMIYNCKTPVTTSIFGNEGTVS